MPMFNYITPTMIIDPSGKFAISLLVVGFIDDAVMGETASVVSQGITNGWDNINGWQVALDGTIGGLGFIKWGLGSK